VGQHDQNSFSFVDCKCAPARPQDFILQQAKISFNVHVGTFTSIAHGYTACTQALAPAQFDVIIRTRPDSEFNIDKYDAELPMISFHTLHRDAVYPAWSV
jgi:hypothetical protein